MKNSTLTSLLAAIAFIASGATAFYGQLRLDEECSEGCNLVLNINDYNTGSTYTCGTVNPSFCTYEGACNVL
ncbi:hypothetical protein B7463_g8178, partial [Scytalidium lignicola]